MRVRSYVINQPPIPWQRARMHAQKFFDAQAKEKLHFAITVQSQHDNEPIFSTPIMMELKFFMPMPINIANALRKNKPGATKIHSVRPDIDNLTKFVLDAISKGVLLSDDKIVYSITATKMYDEKPRTEFTITEY